MMMASITRTTTKLALKRHLFTKGKQPTSAGTLAAAVSRFHAPNISLGARPTLVYNVQQDQYCNQHEKPGACRYFSSPSENYLLQKKAKKELRTKLFIERKEHKEKVKRRRDGRPKSVLKKKFEVWFKNKKRNEEINNSKAKKLGLDWKIQVSVVLERLPIVLPDREKWEAEYETLRAYLDQFGREYPEALFGKTEILEIEDLTHEAMLRDLPKGYTPAPRETEADASGEVRTLNRRLKTWVYLAVKDSPSIDAEEESHQWQLPTVVVNDGETLLDASKRAIREKVGDGMEIYYPSNCPMAVDMHVFKREERSQHGNTYGIKTFFMVVQYDDGKVSPDNITVDDFAWLEKSEFVDRINEQQGEQKSMLYQYLLNTSSTNSGQA